MDHPNHHHYHDKLKKSGQIPAFGNWDYANELPITQYFECARQAGLIRYSNSSGDSDAYVPRGDLYAVDLHRSAVHAPPPSRKATNNNNNNNNNGWRRSGENKRSYNGKEQKKQQMQQQKQVAKVKVKVVCDVAAEQPRKLLRNDAVPRPLPRVVPKPVDEDLYKIPAELLHASKRKKRLGIFSRCLVPACTS